MNPRPKVRDYMATDLIVLRPEVEILHAMKLLLDKGVSGAPVIDADGKLVGMLSKKDCLRTALNAAYFQEWGSPVSGFMTTKVETIDADMDLVTAAEWFLGSHFRRFPVMQDDQLVGQISRADVLRALVENWR
jgi:predicted transcriptional regulator